MRLLPLASEGAGGWCARRPVDLASREAWLLLSCTPGLSPPRPPPAYCKRTRGPCLPLTRMTQRMGHRGRQHACCRDCFPGKRASCPTSAIRWSCSGQMQLLSCIPGTLARLRCAPPPPHFHALFASGTAARRGYRSGPRASSQACHVCGRTRLKRIYISIHSEQHIGLTRQNSSSRGAGSKDRLRRRPGHRDAANTAATVAAAGATPACIAAKTSG